MTRRKARHRQGCSSWAWPVAILLTFAGCSSAPLGLAARSAWDGDWQRAWMFLAIFCALTTVGCVVAAWVLLLYGQAGKVKAQ